MITFCAQVLRENSDLTDEVVFRQASELHDAQTQLSSWRSATEALAAALKLPVPQPPEVPSPRSEGALRPIVILEPPTFVLDRVRAQVGSPSFLFGLSTEYRTHQPL